MHIIKLAIRVSRDEAAQVELPKPKHAAGTPWRRGYWLSRGRGEVPLEPLHPHHGEQRPFTMNACVRPELAGALIHHDDCVLAGNYSGWIKIGGCDGAGLFRLSDTHLQGWPIHYIHCMNIVYCRFVNLLPLLFYRYALHAQAFLGTCFCDL